MLKATSEEVAFDNQTRQLYATDASPYQIVPAAVAAPKNIQQAAALIQAAFAAGISVTPRGAGTGLSGGAIGDGLVIDFARHNRHIWDFNREKRTVRVGAGAVLDQLNLFLRGEGFCFGPDVATSSRATLGGMIANDSSGAHTPFYGTTGQHVNEIEIILASGKSTRIGAHLESLHEQRHLVEDLTQLNSMLITERFAPGLLKRWPGYGLANALKSPGDLIPIVCGSEGTLAAIFSAELKVVPLPEERGVGLLFFDSVAEAMQAAVTLLDLQPAAIEHVDRPLFYQTRGQREFRAVRDLLELDAHPCESILIVEFFTEVKDKLSLLSQCQLGKRRLILGSTREMELVWAMRKAGLSLLTSRKGDAKPVCFIEDAAVRPRDLPAYVGQLQDLMAKVGVEASFYGHAAAGLLHVRPVLDLHRADDLKKFRQIADEVSALVAQFKGSLAGEHGVGIARTEYLKEQIGPELYRIMREIKNSFDPNNLFNPGKIIGDDRYKIDLQLRQGAVKLLPLPFVPQLAFAARDESFVANLEQCNGCGGCLKAGPTMCPTYQATGEEGMSTRGRANLIRAALEQRGSHRDPLVADELVYALDNCLGCRACTNECPSNVNMSLLKAELLHARLELHGRTWRERFLSSVDYYGKLGCPFFPRLTNLLLRNGSVRHILARCLGLAPERPMPELTTQRFDRWFAKNTPPDMGPRGRVILWDDTFSRYHEPHIAIAAVKVLTAAGFGVTLVKQRKCCGRPAFSQGDLGEAQALGRHNLALLLQDDAPIIFIEPSCYSMFKEDYHELGLPGAAAVAARSFLFQQFIETLLEEEPSALQFDQEPANIVVHTHCHAKALSDPNLGSKIASYLPNRTVKQLDTGCCGMAGAFGMLASKYELSLKIAEPLIQQIKQQPYGTTVVLSGASCRHQVQHLANVRTRHIAEVLADALV